MIKSDSYAYLLWVIIVVNTVFTQFNSFGQINTNFLGSDRLICGRAYEYITTNQATNNFIWNNDEITPSIKVYESGKYIIKYNNGASDTVDIYIKQEKKYNAIHWQFGNGQKISYDTVGFEPTSSISSLPNTNFVGGSATFTNSSGKLLLFTNGKSLYDSTGTAIASDLNGNPNLSQNSLFVRKPQSAVYVYLFTIENNNLYYSEIDLRLNSGKGGITPNKKNILLASNVAPKITANRFGDVGSEVAWIVTQKQNSNQYQAFKLNANGISTSAVVSEVGDVYTNDAGYLKFSSDGSMLANSGNHTLLMGFDAGSGKVKLKHSSPIKNTNGIDFSFDGTKLYFNTKDATVDPIQNTRLDGGSIYSLDVYKQDKNGVSTFATDTVFKTNPNNPVGFGAMQMAPNREVVVAQNNNTHPNCLGTLNGNNFTANKICFTQPVGLNLPNFYQFDFKPQASSFIGVNQACLGEKTKIKVSSPLRGKSFANFRVQIQFTDASIAYDTTITDSLAHTFSSFGKYKVDYTIKSACDVENKRDITVSIPPALQLNFSDTSLCSGFNEVKYDLGNVFPNFTTQYELYPSNSTVKIDSVKEVILKQIGSYKALVSIEHCTASDQFSLLQDNTVGVNLGRDIDTCVGSSVVLKPKIKQQGIFTWSTGEISDTIIVSSDGNYSLQFDRKNGCRSNDDIQVSFFNRPIASINISDTTICKGDTIELQLSNTSVSRIWPDASTGSTFRVFNPNEYITKIINQGCTLSLKTQLQQFPHENLGFDAPMSVCANTNQIITLSGGMGSNYLWLPLNETSQSITVKNPDTIYFSKIDPNNCTVKDTLYILSSCAPIVYVPDIFTPNNDAHNQEFKPLALHTNTYEIKIFDRWGNLLYYSQDPSQGWDGTYKNTDVMVGNYSYVIKYDAEPQTGKNTQTKTGTFYLMR